MPDQPDQAPAPVEKPAPVASSEKVKGRFLTRMDTDDFRAHEVLTDPPKALYEKHAHRMRRLQDEAAPQPKGAK
jgi:hypothetical protein